MYLFGCLENQFNGCLTIKLAKPVAAFFLLVTVPAHVVSVFFGRQMWANISYAVGYGLLIPYVLLLLLSLQQRLTKEILRRRANTHYIFLVTVLYVGSIAHRYCYEYEAFSSACFVPNYILIILFFFFMAMADASPERVRSIALRYCNPGACALVLYTVLRMRLPGAEDNQGYRTLWVLGVETMSNMDITGKFGIVLLLLLARGSWSAWRHPKRLAFSQTYAGLVHQIRGISTVSAPKEGFIEHLSASVNPQALMSWNTLLSQVNFDDQNEAITLLSSQPMVDLFKKIQEQLHEVETKQQSCCNSYFMLSTSYQSHSDLRLDFNRDISSWLFGKSARSLPVKTAATFFLLVTVPAHDVLRVFFPGSMWADILCAVKAMAC